MYEGPEFRHLRYFLAVAEELSFGKAAERLHVSQPSLSQQIKQLEEGFKTSLFVRSHHGAALTPAGRELLPLARRMIEMRAHAVRGVSSSRPMSELPLRFGYSPFVNHDLVGEALGGYKELVPGGSLSPHSECSGRLVSMVREGKLDAALVTLPVQRKGLMVQHVCQEDVLICLRRDDPLAALKDDLSKGVIADRLRVMFDRSHHPLLYDKLLRKFDKAGIDVHPSECVSSPGELQYLVVMGRGFGLVRESTRLLPELTTRRIANLELKITTAFVCLSEQAHPALPLLGFRMASHCKSKSGMEGRKKPAGRVTEIPSDKRRLAE